MARQKKVTPATAFTATVRSALEHISDPDWLARYSPLASPYFLSERYAGAGPPAWGHALQTALREATREMWPGALPETRQTLVAAVDDERLSQGSRSQRYRYLLLELRYFRRHFPPTAFPNTVESMAGFVNVSTSRFFIHLEEAIDDLGRHLLERLNPTWRLEQPSPVAELQGRAAVIATLREALLAGRSVAVTGAGGIGKTTVGAALSADWPGPVFWHTFRPGLNDDLNSLLFSLGHFTREHGTPTLWAQLLATDGKDVPVSQALGMLRMDLDAIAGQRPLLCFDEVDLLQTSTGAPRRRQHAQLLELLESLSGAAALLLIGQRTYVDTDVHVALDGLSVDESYLLLRRLGIEADGPTLRRVLAFTQGNPRILELYAALRSSGDEGRDLLGMTHESAAQPLFSRLWRRLDDDERALLGALSVFRSFAPADAVAGNRHVLTSLMQRCLVKADLAGGVGLLPFVRDLVLEALPRHRTRALHEEAAMIRARLGDYTAAAHHYRQAGDADAAVQVWTIHQDQEILAGKMMAATEVFDGLKPSEVGKPRQTELRVIQNRLALLAGDAEQVLEGMEGFRWEEEDPTVAEALGQWALAYERRDQPGRALEKYEEAIAVLARATTRSTGWRLRRSFTYVNEADAQAARHEAKVATVDILRMQGTIELVTGAFESSWQYFSSALALAQELNDTDRIARAHAHLALVAGQQGQIDLCLAHSEQAMEYLASIGDRMQLEGVRAELAGSYLNVRRFESVIEPASQALQYFERIKHDQWIVRIATYLAEAYMETGDLVKAREYAFRALRMEVASSRPYALYTLGHIYVKEANPAHAETSFSEGISIARMNEDPFIEAYLQRSLGALHRDNGRPEESATCFTYALELFKRMGLQHEVEETEKSMAAGKEASPSN